MASTATKTLSTAEDACTVVLDSNHATVAFQLSDVTTVSGGTLEVTFEATVNGSDWVACEAEISSAATQATTASAAGVYTVPCAGLARVRARLNAVTSGESVVATGRASRAAPHWS